MKKVYLTGITGTVAPYIKDALVHQGYHVEHQHFRINNIEEINQMKSYLEQLKPDLIIHAALGPIEITEMFAMYSKNHHIPFVYISTVSVYEDNDGGPYFKDDDIKVKNAYGLYKYTSEQRVLASHSNSYIIRLGWQISPEKNPTSNNMFKFIKEHTDENHNIAVSDLFYPSASFLNDTADAIIEIINKQPGTYLVNGNPKYSLFEILHILKERFQLDINIFKENTFKRNDIMVDPEVRVVSIDTPTQKNKDTF